MATQVTSRLVSAGAIALVIGSGCVKEEMPPETPPEMRELMKARAPISDSLGARLGTVTFEELEDETTKVVVTLNGVPDGAHGMHIHQNGECLAPDFTSAGGHWNPTAAMHGHPTDGEHHLGDLGNIVVASRVGTVTFETPDLSLREMGAKGFLGRAVILHENADDYTTQMPPGNAGARLGCGVIEIDDGTIDDPDPMEMPDPNPVAPNATIEVAGRLLELGAYFAGTTGVMGAGPRGDPVGLAAISTIGLSPEAQINSDDTDGSRGNWKLTMPQNGKTLLHVQKAGYFPTYSEIATGANNIANKRLYVASAAYISSIARAFQVDLEAPVVCTGGTPESRCVYGILIGQIIDDGTAGNGAPRPVEGVTRANIGITDAAGMPAPMKGPFFLTSTGTPSLESLATSRAGLFVAFVEIPSVLGPVSADFRITASYDDANATRYFGPIDVKAFRPYGVTWIYVRETGQPSTPGMPMPEPTGVDFDTQVYPLFLSISQGGYGCQGCHTNAGGAVPAAGLNLYGGPDLAFASLSPTAFPMRVNLTTPAESKLLTKPLYESAGAQDHPIYAFTSVADPAYKIVRKWIEEGALRRTMTPPMRVSLANDVRPLLANPTNQGGMGCDVCHNNILTEGGLNVVLPALELFNELTIEAAVDESLSGELYRVNKLDPGNSLLITNLLVENLEAHPVKLFASTTDPRYTILYRWIAEGAENN
jgi:Cu-Zn family superoxide dismutase